MIKYFFHIIIYKFGGGQFRQYIDSDMEQFLKYQDIKSKNQIEKLIFALKLRLNPEICVIEDYGRTSSD